MKVAHVLQPQDIAMLAAVHKKLGSILDMVNGKAASAASGDAPKKRGPKPGKKKKVDTGKKYDPVEIPVTPETSEAPV